MREGGSVSVKRIYLDMKFKLSKKEEGSLNLPKPINQAYIHVLQGREKIVCNNNKITDMNDYNQTFRKDDEK